MSTILKWFGVLVIVLSLLALAFGGILALEITSRISVPEGREFTMLEALIYSLAGQIVFVLFIGLALMIFLAGVVSYYVGNSGIQGSKQLSLLRDLLSELKRIEYAD